MKKKSRSRIGAVFAQIINIRLWFDWTRMKSSTQYLIGGIKNLFVPQKSAKSESFAKAVAALKLSEDDLLSKQKSLLRLSLFMVAVAAVVFVYAGYQLFYGSFLAVLVSLVLTMLALVIAFRYHFWYFQIKRRKLGCTIQEWYRQGLLGEDK